MNFKSQILSENIRTLQPCSAHEMSLPAKIGFSGCERKSVQCPVQPLSDRGSWRNQRPDQKYFVRPHLSGQRRRRAHRSAFPRLLRTGIDNVVAISPTYGMYRVAADINNITYREVLLEKISVSMRIRFCRFRFKNQNDFLVFAQ